MIDITVPMVTISLFLSIQGPLPMVTHWHRNRSV